MRTIVVKFGSGLNDNERDALREGLKTFKDHYSAKDIFKIDFYRRSSKNELYSADWIIQKAVDASESDDKAQLDADVILRWMRRDPGLKQYPHVSMLFTSFDLAGCYGKTKGMYTVQSLYRYRGLQPDDCKAVIKKVLWNELGGMLGLRRDDLHPKNRPCAMHQEYTITEKVRYARELTRQGSIYCRECDEKISESKRVIFIR